MQKKLLAVAVLGALSSAAFAQSANVTVYGRMKYNYEQISMNGASNSGFSAALAAASGGIAAGTAGAVDNNFKLGRMQQSSSLIGFRGTEDLGNGLSAIWQIETDVGGDEQNSGSGTFANRDTFAGLRSNTWGQIAFGHWDTFFVTTSRYLEGASSYSWSLGTDAALNLMNRSQSGVQSSFHSGNTIQYVSPNWNGFVWKQQFSPSAFGTERSPLGQTLNTTTGQAVNGQANSRQWMTDISYTNGPWVGGLTYIKTLNGFNSPAGYATQNGVTAVPPSSSPATFAGAAVANPNYAEMTQIRVGGSYTFGMGVRVGLIYDKLKDTQATPLSAAQIAGNGSLQHSRTAWALPVSYKWGNHTVQGIYAKANQSNGVANSNGAGGAPAGVNNFSDTSAKSWSIGYDYAFSKRTSVGASYTTIINGDNASYDFWSRGVGGASPVGVVANGQDPKMFSIGMRHIF